MNETKTNPLDELRESWPQDDSGRACLKLVLTFLTEKLLATAAGNECKDRAEGEAAADKTYANLVQQFRLVTVPVAETKTVPVLKPLRRHQTETEGEPKPPSEK